MQPPFPTKKFFLVLLFLLIAASGVHKLFGFLNNRAAQKAADERSVAIIQNEIVRQIQGGNIDPLKEPVIAASTLNAVAAVVYLNEQTKANGATIEEIASAVGNQIHTAKVKLETDVYTKNALTINPDNSPDALKKYGNDMAGIFLKYGKEKQPNHLDVVKNALENGDKKELAKLDPYIKFQENVIKDAIALNVPESISAAHLRIINSSAQMLLLLRGFRSSFDDLPSAIASNALLETASRRFATSFKEADAVFKQNGIVFLPEENGILFSSFSE